MNEHFEAALKSLRSMSGPRTNNTKATVAVAQATLALFDAVERQTDTMIFLWKADPPTADPPE